MTEHGHEAEMISDNSVAVVWYDGNQQCKVFNVLPLENRRDDNGVVPKASPCPIHGAEYVGYLHVHDPNTHKCTQGIDNTAFYKNTEDDDEMPSCSSYENTPSCSWHRNKRRDSSSGSLRRPSNSSACPSSNNASCSHTNSAFEIQNEHSCESDAKCGPIISCTCSSTLHTFTDENILEVTPAELESDVGSSVPNVGDNNSKSKIHVIKRNMLRPNSVEQIVVCNVCQNEIPITNNHNTNVETEEPPPNYSSLRFMFLADEPPKYQDVTGKSLTSASIPVRHRILSEATKRRIVIGCVVIFFLLIGALLVYACFVSGHPLGSYGAAPRKF